MKVSFQNFSDSIFNEGSLKSLTTPRKIITTLAAICFSLLAMAFCIKYSLNIKPKKLFPLKIIPSLYLKANTPTKKPIEYRKQPENKSFLAEQSKDINKYFSLVGGANLNALSMVIPSNKILEVAKLTGPFLTELHLKNLKPSTTDQEFEDL